ncbi:hypothetical protein SEUCBS139899_006768 [Sporothrix eucalyptigena]|uniref:Major facilitator superfamily (MFS) profile domain-containing protein n=1 Tax=Sporothrix eucalyptigena TaxID=1812306 RepID=A0ABP0CX94_9PEZI
MADDTATGNAPAQPSIKAWWSWRLAYNLIVISLAMVLYGYDNAFTSPLVSLPLFVAKYQSVKNKGLTAFTADELDLLICVPLIGAVLGAVAGVPLQRWLGRRKTMMLAYAAACVPGSFLQLFAPNMGALVVGRFWNGVGISVLTSVVPLFLAELVPAHVRGRTTGLATAGSGASSVVATVVVWATSKLADKRQYQIPLAIQAALAAFLLILSWLLTESPSWLVSKGRLEDARSTLVKLRGNENVEYELQSIASVLVAAAEADAAKSVVRFKEILTRKNWARTFMASSYLPASQVGGQTLVVTYSTVLFVQAGVSNVFLMTILVFLLQFVGNSVGPYLADRLGRRILALGGIGLLVILDFSAGGLACAGLTSKPQLLGLAALSCIFAFVNAASFQCLAFILPTEIPDPTLREPTMTWALFWSYATAIITTFATPQIMNSDAPETARRTLEEIDDMYRSGIPPRKWGRKPRTEGNVEMALRVKDIADTEHGE